MLNFVCDLPPPTDTDIHARILAKLEQDPDLMLQQVTVEC